jgi:hypothetical protein
MVVGLILAAACAWWSSRAVAEKRLTAQRLQENARRITRAASDIGRLMPRTLEGDVPGQVNALIDSAC